MKIPKRRRGRQSTALAEAYRADLVAFCEALEAIDNTLDIKVSSRGWCYALEEHGLGKDEFDYAQRLINDCRKSGLLPVDFTASDIDRIAYIFSERAVSLDSTDVPSFSMIGIP